jgi:hypothetical protein
MSRLATKDYIAFFFYLTTLADYGYSILLKKEKSSNRYKIFFPGRWLMNMAELFVLRQKMRSKKFQNFKL